MVDTIYVVIEKKTRTTEGGVYSHEVPDSEVVAAFREEDAAVKFIDTTRSDYDGKLGYDSVDLLRGFDPVEEQDL